jgi:hypothetical protein
MASMHSRSCLRDSSRTPPAASMLAAGDAALPAGPDTTEAGAGADADAAGAGAAAGDGAAAGAGAGGGGPRPKDPPPPPAQGEGGVRCQGSLLRSQSSGKEWRIYSPCTVGGSDCVVCPPSLCHSRCTSQYRHHTLLRASYIGAPCDNLKPIYPPCLALRDTLCSCEAYECYLGFGKTMWSTPWHQ